MDDPFADLRDDKPLQEQPFQAKTALLSGVRPEFMQRFLQMAQDYQQRTGKQLVINDAWRSQATQAEAHRRKPGLAAPAGQSLHPLGLAMDIDQNQAAQLSQMGLLQKYGFDRPMMSRAPGHKYEPWHIQMARNFGKEAEVRGATSPETDPFADLRKPSPPPHGPVFTGKIEKPWLQEYKQAMGTWAAMPEAQFAQETGEMIGKAIDLPHQYISKPLGEAIAGIVPEVDVPIIPFPEAQWVNSDLEMPIMNVPLREAAKIALPFALDFPVYGAVGRVLGAGVKLMGPKPSALPKAEKIMQTVSEGLGKGDSEVNKLINKAKKLTEPRPAPSPYMLHGGVPDTVPWVKKAITNLKETGKRAGKDIVEITKEVREDLGITGNERSKMIIEEAMGRRRDSHQRTIAALQTWQDELAKMTDQEQLLQAAKYQKGEAVNPELKPLFDTIKDLNETKYNEVNEVGGRHLSHRENYIRGGVFKNQHDPVVKENQVNFFEGKPFDNHLDLDPQGKPYKSIATLDADGNVTEVRRVGGVGEASAPGTETEPYRMFKGKTLTGGRAYFKGKVFPSWQEPLMVGYQPKHGLMDLMLFDLGQKDHYIYGMRAWNQARKEGLIKFYVPGSQPMEWQKINDPMGRINIPYLTSTEEVEAGIGRVPKHEPGMPADVEPRVSRWEAYAPKEIAKPFNNFLSQGLRGHPLYDRIRSVTDASRKFGVSFSPFHAKVTLNTDMSMGIGEHGSKALGSLFTGDPMTAAKEAGKLGKAISGTRTVEGLLQAGKITRKYYQGELTGKVANGVDEYIRAGGSMPTADTINGIASSMSRAMKEVGRQFGDAHILRAIDKSADVTSVPIMQYMVPYAKLTSFLMKRERMFPEWQAAWKGKTATKAAQADWARRMRSIRRFDDAMYGQVAYDNLHLHNIVKDALFFIIKYPGWNLGSGRWITGNIKGAYQGVRSMLGGEPMGEFQKQSLKFTAGLIMKNAMFGTLLYALIHRKYPDNPIEIVTKGVWTGGYDRSGAKQYVRDADYMRDLLGIVPMQGGRFSLERPLTTITHKMPSMVGLPWHLLSNEDYFGGKILTPGEPTKWPLEIGKAIGKEFVPYSAQQITRGKSPWARYGQFMGYTLTPASQARTNLENIIAEYNISRAPRGETPEKRELYERRATLEDLGREGKTEEFKTGLKQMRQEGVITKSQAKNIKKRVADVRGFRFAHLPVDVAAKAWEAGTDEEKAFYGPIFRRKINNLVSRDIKKYRELKHYKKEISKYKKKPEYDLDQLGLPAPWQVE